MIDLLRAEWFREHARFEHCGLIDRCAAWSSWNEFCVGRCVDAGSKTQMWNWLLRIGLARHGSLFRGAKMK